MKLAAVGDNCMDVYDNLGKAYPGGNPVNVAVYFVRLGGEASYTGVVGTDSYGTLMKQSIGAKGVDVSHIRFEEGSTAVSHVELINGDRIFGEYEEGVMADFKLTEESWEQKRTDVKEYHVDTFVMGDDWKGKFDFLKEEGCEVVYLPRTPEISSSQIKEDLHTNEINKN